MCELARALVNCGRSMKIATFSTRDLQEQCRKSYVASYQAYKELVILWMFSRELHQWRWFTKVFFCERFPIYSTLKNLAIDAAIKYNSVGCWHTLLKLYMCCSIVYLLCVIYSINNTFHSMFLYLSYIPKQLLIPIRVVLINQWYRWCLITNYL